MYRRAIFSCFSPSSAVPTILIRYISSYSHIVLSVQNKDLKQMAHHRKKVAGHKLDYDCKKRHGEQGTGMVDAEKKFADSYKVGPVKISAVKMKIFAAGCPAEHAQCGPE